MTNNALPKGLTEACNKFYRAFDHMPTQIYVNWHRKVHLPPYVNVAVLPAMSLIEALAKNDPSMPTANFVSVPLVAEDWKDVLHYSTKTGSYVKSGLEWEDFALYSAKTGKVKPEDLTPSAELVKLGLQARGYKVLIGRGESSSKFYIFKYPEKDTCLRWAFYEPGYADYTLDAIKAEVDYILEFIS